MFFLIRLNRVLSKAINQVVNTVKMAFNFVLGCIFILLLLVTIKVGLRDSTTETKENSL